MTTEPLPEYRVKARNTSEASENKIHDDAVARQYGFRGGLVPGVTVYAYMTRPLVEAFGAAWLARGTATVRFVKPVLDGEEVTVSGSVTGRDAKAVTAALTASTAAGGECATLSATLPAGTPVPVNPALYAAAPLPAERPAATREHLGALAVLGTPVDAYSEAAAAEYLDGVSDALPLYRGAGARAHPAFFLHQANRALSQNVRMGPWIHVGSTVRHLGGARLPPSRRPPGRRRRRALRARSAG
ncbi:MAG: MaoC family dehydratase, partial [candidate division NC10 bacterium]